MAAARRSCRCRTTASTASSTPTGGAREAYLDPAVRAGISAFALMDPALRGDGLARLARDLESGEWARRNAELLELDELDGGYRLVVHEG